MRFQLIDAANKDFPVQRLCKVLGVSPSGYFAWRRRPASPRQQEDLVLLAHIRSAFALSNETYGSPRITRELQDGVVTGTVFTSQERVCRAVCLTQFQRLSDRKNGLRRPQNALYLLDVTVPIVSRCAGLLPLWIAFSRGRALPRCRSSSQSSSTWP